MRKVSGVYRIRNILNDKRYVGHSYDMFGGRKKTHLSQLTRGRHHCFYLQASWNKHGRDAFVWEMVEETPPIKSVMEAREQVYIDLWRGMTYNMSKSAYGGPGGAWNKGIKTGPNMKMSLAARGRIPWNKGIKGKMIAWNKGMIGRQVAWNKGAIGRQVGWNKGLAMPELQRTKMQGQIQITNGVKCRKHPADEPIPEGWRREYQVKRDAYANDPRACAHCHEPKPYEVRDQIHCSHRCASLAKLGRPIGLGRQAYEASPRRCLTCDTPITWERKARKFCDQACDIAFRVARTRARSARTQKSWT